MTTERITDKVRKLLRLAARNSNVHEAAAAAAQAQALIDEYQLSTALLEVDGAEPAEPEEPIVDFGKKGAPLDTAAGGVERWKGSLAVHLADANGAKVYKSGGSLQIIGRGSDVDTVRYLFAYCAGECLRLSKEQGAGLGWVWQNNFRIGCVDTIARKLRDARQARTQEMRQLTAGNSMALMRLDRALARVEQRRTSVELWTKVNVKLHNGSKGRYVGDGAARRAGQIAGERIHVTSRAKGAIA